MKHIAALVPFLLGLTAAPRDGEIKAVSVLPAARSVEVVIDLQGAVDVQDFTLASPARLVIDLQGARLVAPAVLYDGQNRGGIKNLRYAQFRPGVVRVVIDLDVLKDYQVERRAGQVRVKIGTERTAFAAWSSQDLASRNPGLAPAVSEPGVASTNPGRKPGVRAGEAARVAAPAASGTELSIDAYLAAHAREGEQSQAPRITVTWDNSDIGKVVADSTTNALVITEISSRISRVEDFVKGLDIRTPQVSIQAKIIFVDRTDVEQLGLKYDLGSQTQFFNKLIQRPDPRTAKAVDTNGDGIPDAFVPQSNFSPDQVIVDLGGNSLSALGNADQEIVNPALNLIFSTAIGNFNLSTFLQALQRVELADLQAEPTITTLDNRPAEILVGDRVPIRVIDAGAAGVAGQPARATVRFEQTGINLKVTPHVTANRQVLMEVHAENSAVKPSSVDIGFTFQTQQADNQILVSDGETAVIGGLTVTSVTVSKSGIPFLVDLPLLGKLFGFTTEQEERRDLLILVTPHIIDDLVTPSTGK